MEEDEDWGGYSNGTETEDQETINLKDWNDEEYNHNNPSKRSPGFIPKLQFRKDVSKARWDEDTGMAKVTEKKGGMWRTTGIIRGGNLYCLLEEILSTESGNCRRTVLIWDVEAQPNRHAVLGAADSRPNLKVGERSREVKKKKTERGENVGEEKQRSEKKNRERGEKVCTLHLAIALPSPPLLRRDHHRPARRRRQTRPTSISVETLTRACSTKDPPPSSIFIETLTSAQNQISLSFRILKRRSRRTRACQQRYSSLVRFLAERGALILLDANDAALSLTDIYEKVAKDKNGCSWESFEVYRHLKSLGYIINRYGLPWTLKINKSCCNSKCLEGTLDSDDTSKPTREDETSSIICQLKEMRINEMMPNFDVYLPNSKFRKSAPGNPSFLLYLLSDDPPSKAEIQVLEECKGIPLKFCHLEHGRVSFFSFDKVELPFLP